MPVNLEQPSLQQLGYLIAEASQSVVFVTGAGLSQPAGVPMWARLLENLKSEAQKCLSAGPQNAETLARQKELDRLTDPWAIGDLVEACIPNARYGDFVKEQLGATAVPESYHKLWRLRPSGVVSFNLDALAEIALDGAETQSATWKDELRFERFLLLSKPFLFQPHGALEKPHSWVLSGKARNRLLRHEPYRRFASALLRSRRLVVVGFRPEDISFQSLLLDDFRTELTKGVSHFWICPEPDADARAFARLYNLSLIEYAPSEKAHPEVPAILDRLATFRPREPLHGAVYEGQGIELADLPQDDDLRKLTVEDIRVRLNAALKGLEQRFSDRGKYADALKTFFSKYGLSLHTAWHIQEKSPYEVVWGARATAKLGGGAFGGVWLAEEPVDGEPVAIKVLHENVLQQPDFLDAFRRGVHAMRILTDAGIKGMVRYVRAYDVPACVFMEYVDGHTLDQVMQGSFVTALYKLLRIVEDVGSIVRSGHDLDQHVLHRDLKPSNVMLKHVFDEDRAVETFVLDFDLSWYEGAIGHSMMAGTLNNYIAPEQLNKGSSRHSSRHTGVDVFGLGMLLYFVCTKTQPAIGIHNTKDFLEGTVQGITSAWRRDLLPGMSTYLGYVILEATYEDQTRRCGLSTLVERIREVRTILEADTVKVPSMLSALVAVDALLSKGWEARIDLNQMETIALRNMYVRAVVGKPPMGTSLFDVRLEFSGGPDMPRGAEKERYLKPRIERSRGVLAKAGFSVAHFELTGGAFTLAGSLNEPQWTRRRAIEIGTAIAAAAETLLFNS